MQPIGLHPMDVGTMPNHVKSQPPSILSSSLNFFYIFHCHQIQVFHTISEPQISNECFSIFSALFHKFLPHLFHKYIHKASHPKSCSFRKLITEISPSHQDWKKPSFSIRIRASTHRHARTKASKPSPTRLQCATAFHFQICILQPPIKVRVTSNQ